MEELVGEARERLQRGEPPTDEAMHEWIRIKRETLIRRNQVTRKDDDDEIPEDFTTAEPRPNAYIPEDLGIPKPYGSHPPFKPTPIGSNARHIKKPKPIEESLLT